MVVLAFAGWAGAARGGLITYQVTTDITAPTLDGVFTGFITFNSNDVFAGNTVQSSSFEDWQFTWGSSLDMADDGTNDFTLSGTNGNYTRVGRLVHIHELDVIWTSKASASGIATRTPALSVE